MEANSIKEVSVCSGDLPLCLEKHKPIREKVVKAKTGVKKKETKKRGAKDKKRPCGACELISILAGDTQIVRLEFFGRLKNKHFGNIKRQSTAAIEMFADDVCQNVFLALAKKYHNDTLKDIEEASGYWRWIVFRLGCNEHERIGNLQEFIP